MRATPTPPLWWRPLTSWASLAVLALALTAVACAPDKACDGIVRPQQPGSPRINHIDLVAPPDVNPWEAVLAVDFTDTGGDLGRGKAFVYLNGTQIPKGTYDLSGFFYASQLELDATQGVFALFIPLPNDVRDGATWRMDILLEDASDTDPKGLYSNCYRLNLDFKVDSISRSLNAWLNSATRVASRWVEWLKSSDVG